MQGSFEVGMLRDWRALSCFGSRVDEPGEEGVDGDEDGGSEGEGEEEEEEEFFGGVGEEIGDGVEEEFFGGVGEEMGDGVGEMTFGGVAEKVVDERRERTSRVSSNGGCSIAESRERERDRSPVYGDGGLRCVSWD